MSMTLDDLYHMTAHIYGERNAERPGNDATREPLSASERASRESARARLSPTARKILDTVTRRGQNGPELDADQITMVGLIVPPDLSASEVWEILDRIGAGEEPSQSGSDVIERIDEAVREVRNRNRTVMVDGKKRPDLAATSNGPAQPEAAEGPITSPGQVDGPITSPEQVQGPQASQTADGARPISDPAVVVYNGPPAVVARWFQSREHGHARRGVAAPSRARSPREIAEAPLKNLTIQADEGVPLLSTGKRKEASPVPQPAPRFQALCAAAEVRRGSRG